MISLEIKGIGKVINQFSNYTRTIPKAGRRGIWLLAMYGQRAMKEEAKNSGIKSWHNVLYPSIKAEKINKDTWGIKMSKEGLYLDRMKPHFVSLKRGRKITRWARSKGINAGAIYVKPHPFTVNAFRRIEARAKETVEKQINDAIKKK